MVRVYLGLGSNIGERRQQLFSAVEQLIMMDAVQEPLLSPLYQSPALLPDNAPAEWDKPFINAVLQAETWLTPQALLQAVKEVEATLGRQKRGHWGPREIDIDILAYGNEVISGEELSIPHAGLAQRDFVLLPWREIAPDWTHPQSGVNIAAMCDALTEISATPLSCDVKEAI